MKGKVKKFDKDKGYGFITLEDGRDAFFHFSAIVADGYRAAEAGDDVEIEAEETDRGLRATRVVKL